MDMGLRFRAFLETWSRSAHGFSFYTGMLVTLEVN